MKEAFYFPHDVNAIQDPKMMTLLTECGPAGIGLFWILIEILHQQEWGAIGYPEALQYIAFYGKQGSWDQVILDKFQKVIFDTKLLVLEDDKVTSPRVKNNIQRRIELRNNGRENALKRWQPNGVPLATQCDPNAIKERKGKEKKEKINSIVGQPPNDGDSPTPQDLLDLWNQKAHPSLPRVRFLTESRKRQALIRLKENPDQSFWDDLFARVNASPLLRGEVGSWKATFDWVMKPQNMTKVLEGNYDAGIRR